MAEALRQLVGEECYRQDEVLPPGYCTGSRSQLWDREWGGRWDLGGAAETLQLPGCWGEARGWGWEVIQGRTRFSWFATAFPQHCGTKLRCWRAQLGQCSWGDSSARLAAGTGVPKPCPISRGVTWGPQALFNHLGCFQRGK